MRRVSILAVAAIFLLGLMVSFAYTQEAIPEGPSEDDLDKLLVAPPKPAATDEQKAADEASAEKSKDIEQSFPTDPRNIRITVKYKSGKTVSGRVLHFLKSVNLVDHVGDPELTVADGLTVQYQTDEFSIGWDKLLLVDFSKGNKENGEISCYEDSDKSPDRMECTMINQYQAFSKALGKKAPHIIVDGDLFRFVVDTGKGLVNVDSHLGRVKITNERDERRRMEDMEKELRTLYKDAILSISFH
jgi:hypothetical protein